MIKVTVLYGHPVDPDTFESYYFSTHFALLEKMKAAVEILKAETTKFLPDPDGSKPPYYRMAELYFSDPEALQNALGSPEGIATTGDLANFASGGATILVGVVD